MEKSDFLTNFQSKEVFAQIDIIFAKKMGGEAPMPAQVFLAALMANSRRGHLCMSIESGCVTPSFENKDLDALIVEGSKLIDLEAYQEFIVKEENAYYFKKNWEYETRVVEELTRLLSLSVPSLEVKLEGCLNEKQKEAVSKALQTPIMIITGGPGTGKTFVAEQIVKEMLSQNKQVIIGAPTGKAAANLQRFSKEVRVGTVHSLLGIKQRSDFQRKKTLLFADLIIIDECSMIDVALFAKLLSSIKSGTRLILLGDNNQLPPVDSGTIFHEICAFAQKKKKNAYTHLTECQRCDQKELLEIAEQVNIGNVEEALKKLRPKLQQTFDAKNIASHFSPEYTEDYEKIFERFNRFRILSSLRKGPSGVDVINETIYQTLKKCDPFVVPILITQTSYSKELYNGESGILVQHSLNPSINYAIFPSKKGEEKYRKIPEALLPPYEYGYCCSIHKSQGGEYDQVLILLPEGSERFGREILYTAITRAKHQIQLISPEEVIRKVLQSSSQKASSLEKRLF